MSAPTTATSDSLGAAWGEAGIAANRIRSGALSVGAYATGVD